MVYGRAVHAGPLRRRDREIRLEQGLHARGRADPLQAALADRRRGRDSVHPRGREDCDNLVALGLVATCNPGGAGKWRQEFSAHFSGVAAVILPDNDEPGRKHAADVARSLLKRGLKVVRVLESPGLAPKGDVSDWLAAGGTKEQLLEASKPAPKAEDWLKGQPEPEPKAKRDYPYEATAGGIVWHKPTKDGSVPVQLTNFIARVTDAIVYDEGLGETEIKWAIETGYRGRARTIEAKADQFAAMHWVPEIAVGARVYPGLAQHAAGSIQDLSADGAVERTRYGYTGWRQIGGQWVFLHAGGAIGARGLVDGIDCAPLKGTNPALLEYRLRRPQPPGAWPTTPRCGRASWTSIPRSRRSGRSVRDAAPRRARLDRVGFVPDGHDGGRQDRERGYPGAPLRAGPRRAQPAGQLARHLHRPGGQALGDGRHDGPGRRTRADQRPEFSGTGARARRARSSSASATTAGAGDRTRTSARARCAGRGSAGW